MNYQCHCDALARSDDDDDGVDNGTFESSQRRSVKVKMDLKGKV